MLYCYTIKNNLEYKSPYQLWDNSLQNDLKSIEIEHDEIMSSDQGLIRWLELLHHTGIAIVKNAPTENNSGFKILNRISHTRETFFKTPKKCDTCHTYGSFLKARICVTYVTLICSFQKHQISVTHVTLTCHV